MHGGQSRVWSAQQEKENKRRKSANASTLMVRRKKTKAKKSTRREQEEKQKITVGQKSTTILCIYNKPTHYEASSVCDSYSLPRPYRVDVQNVSMRGQIFL